MTQEGYVKAVKARLARQPDWEEEDEQRLDEFLNRVYWELIHKDWTPRQVSNKTMEQAGVVLLLTGVYPEKPNSKD